MNKLLFVSPFYCLQSEDSSSSVRWVVARLTHGHVRALGDCWLLLGTSFPLGCGRTHQWFGIVQDLGKHLHDLESKTPACDWLHLDPVFVFVLKFLVENTSLFFPLPTPSLLCPSPWKPHRVFSPPFILCEYTCFYFTFARWVDVMGRNKDGTCLPSRSLSLEDLSTFLV